jgi:malto-oligosyltrehalose synthase/4-alpha-glucanotransferase
MYNPVSTYRVQFHKGFNFKNFKAIIPYLAKLGIKTIYASPIFKATPGSMHGYDVTDPLSVNPEIGTLNELMAISKQLQKLGIGWLQDIVPNHMAFHPENKWLMDVLKFGQESSYAPYFDILWDVTGQNGRLMVPFLGKSLDETLEGGELSIIYNNGLCFNYMGQQYPLNIEAYKLLNLKAGVIVDDEELKRINSNSVLLKKVSAIQYYRLCSWEETNHHINYRRFFTVNGLICLNIQDEEVFDGYHQFIGKLISEGIFQGLRVDHIDGFHDPEVYLKRLRTLAGEDTYIITEKILEAGEAFPSNWPVQGNTGYDMLSAINNLFSNKRSKKKLSAFYKALHTGNATIEKRIFEKKRLILKKYMPGELDNLFQLFINIRLTPAQRKIPFVREAIAELMIRFPTYRYYINSIPLPKNEAKNIHGMLDHIKLEKPGFSDAVNVIRAVLLDESLDGQTKKNERVLKFLQRLMQFTGPLMAKGVEDTLMYTYNRFIDHNEVGDSPDSFGISSKHFHEAMKGRLNEWPLSMIATSTHDTKRGEDVHARLNVLSDAADNWVENVLEWQNMNRALKTSNLPDDNDEYFIYQTIIGTLPMPGQDENEYNNRLGEYLVKALREGKVNSNWAQPNETYENAAKTFAMTAAERVRSSSFFKEVVDYGIINSLAQVLIKYTIPGVPDLYQGCEFWDLSFVDPDNRRPVDHRQHKILLEKIDPKNISWSELWEHRYNGCIKQQLTRLLLHQRKEKPDLYSMGEYIHLKVHGRYKKNVFAFARHFGKEWVVVLIPLHLASSAGINFQQEQIDWEDTKVNLPDNSPHYWKNIIDGSEGYAEKQINISTAFKLLPFAVLNLTDKNKKRGAGILMHITSLPSAYGVGDLGPAAYQFADFLFESGQKYWQLLPLNPVEKNADFSPYSSTSAMAGNTMLISPNLLVKNGWLDDNDLSSYRLKPSVTAQLEQAEVNKNILFDVAFGNFLKSNDSIRSEQFSAFKLKEDHWLSDFAVYQLLKEMSQGKPWYQWAEHFKHRNINAINKIAKKHKSSLEKIKWLQWVFTLQWNDLKTYCDRKGITFIGDMPFYMSYDSVEVWVNPQLFKLDDKRDMAGIAGVPPDYFSKQGQLWGMPVYNWPEHNSQSYNWWIARIKKNLEYFKIIRLDHFRAFSQHWEVPAGNDTAINGDWKTGPGRKFFEAVQKSIGNLPFVAEDLGEINDEVYKLRDEFNLPGMRVLQFAFYEGMAVSPHITHNFEPNTVAYTGTHDNNTTLGWFNKEIDNQTNKRLSRYMGKKVKENNVNLEMIRLNYSSVANIVIIPLQDIINLDEHARMNTPSSKSGNWRWSLESFKELFKANKIPLKKLTLKYNR